MNEVLAAFDYYFEDLNTLKLRVKYNTLRSIMEVIATQGWKNAGVVELVELAKSKALVESQANNKYLNEAADLLLDIWKQEHNAERGRY